MRSAMPYIVALLVGAALAVPTLALVGGSLWARTASPMAAVADPVVVQPVDPPPATPTAARPTPGPPALPTPFAIEPSPAVSRGTAATPTSTPAPRDEFAQRYQNPGTVCRLEPPAGRSSFDLTAIEFTVPDDMVAWECRVLTFGRDWFNVQCDCIYPITVGFGEASLAGRLDQLTRDLVEPVDRWAAPLELVDSRYAVLAGVSSWVFDLDVGQDPVGFDRPHLERRVHLDAAGLELVARNRDDEGHDYDRTLAALGEVLDSVRIERPTGAVASPLPRTGGDRCVGATWSFTVPDGWFTAACVSLNTSSEGDVALQCECVGPVQVDETSATAVMEPLDELLETESASWTAQLAVPVEVSQGPVQIDGEYETSARQVVIRAGGRLLRLQAFRSPDHAAPGHTWDRTLDGLASLLNSFAVHEETACHGRAGAHRVAPWRDAIELRSDPDGPRTGRLAPRARVVLTGCVAGAGRDGDELWVEADLATGETGWVRQHDVASLQAPTCASTATAPDWLQHAWSASGDFDGDGLEDQFLVESEVGAPREPHEADGLAVQLGSGALLTRAGDLVEPGAAAPPFRVRASGIEVLRPAGLGHDVAVVSAGGGGAYTTPFAMLDVDDCAIRLLGTWIEGASVRNVAGRCVTPTVDGDVLRLWQAWLPDDASEFEIQADDVLVWSGTDAEPQPLYLGDGFERLEPRPIGLCGPSPTG